MWLIASLLACAPPPPAGTSLVLITLDTTRADALGVYGGPEGASPNLDRLAREGVRFEWALSHAPSTLSSHASLFTGLDPHGHGIPRNGYPLDPGHSTLAERLRERGYDTLAAVGSSALEAAMGLDRGFRRYDDALSRAGEGRFEDRADAVTARALDLVDQRDPKKPLFLWVHYFDAHSPYDPPKSHLRFVEPGYQPRYTIGNGIARASQLGRASQADRDHLRGLYQGEVAFEDEQAGALLDGLRARRLLEDALVVVTADHGEMFFENPERPVGHGSDVDLALTRVPLLLRGYGAQALTPRTVSEPVALSEIGGTLLSLLGDEGGLGEGRDLRPLLAGEPIEPAPIFMEATQPHQQEVPGRWNNHRTERGVVWGGQVLYLCPVFGERPALFALAPGQPPADPAAPVGPMVALLRGWDEAAPPYRAAEMSATTTEALRALGYIED